ncbi:IclR family transcriptional regulator [Amnibacterium flavum]|uniref:Glycerol operon regulatory protein n=1 Tax=Amnibacterium flavum TaxID=2173173 RepID=A0A2V1HRN5_9MICO|nr:IclR family transcriptional regulator [Amnibacterium flavum]PVZ95245.1 IclR family transcriptional regulator [Amnibacterium flavum]
MTNDLAAPPREGNSTADRALSILEMFSHQRRQISARDVAAGLGVARSTAYRYLQTLVSASYLEESPEGGFRLGAKILELAQVAQGRNNLPDLALPEMRRIATEFGQTVLLTKLVGDSILCLEQEDSPTQFVRLSYRRGGQMAVNAGASALACIAWMTGSALRELLERQPLPHISESTVTDVDRLLDRLDQVRRDGYVVTRGEVDPEGMGIGVPVYDGEGQVVGALSVVGLQTRIDAATVPRIVDTLLAASASVTAGLSSYGS